MGQSSAQGVSHGLNRERVLVLFVDVFFKLDVKWCRVQASMSEKLFD